jgi:glycosyltransferase involved in cell wall biosynthesis
MRFHALAVPHTITNKEEFVACAYTQKVLKFCEMMVKRGHEVYHYGHEDSNLVCTEHVSVISRETYNRLYGTEYHRTKFFKFDQNDEVYQEFYNNTPPEINKRKKPGDFLLPFWGWGNKPVCDALPDLITVEPGIGYACTFAPYRIYESWAILHASIGFEKAQIVGSIPYYHTVIPNYFDPKDFEFNKNKKDYFLCLGRISKAKGVDFAIQITEKIGARLVIAGQGGPEDLGLTEWPAHVEYVGYALLEKRKELMKNAKALFILSTYLEPFGGAMVESLFCGTPVISSDFGCFVENNLHGITGYRCRTFGQMVWAAQNIDRIDPQACLNWAQNFSVDRIAPMYEEYFQSIHDGWYAKVSSQPLLQLKNFPQDISSAKVAVWQSTNGALGRISRAIEKYIPNTDVYEWSELSPLWTEGLWKNYDFIISTTDIHRIEELYPVSPDSEKLVVISHCPRFDNAHFCERMDNIREGATYAGVSEETCLEMSKYGIRANWTPFGADGDEFPKTHEISGPIKKVGIVMRECTNPTYTNVKGLGMFTEIYRLGGFDPILISTKTENLYDGIDVLICCSEFEAGPLGLFEAAASGIPILTTRVGNAQFIKGVETFTTAQEAVDRINYWNNNLEKLKTYTDRVTHEVRSNWNMEVLIKKHLSPLLVKK